MSLLRLILRSATFHRRMNLSVAAGVAVATAVLTGALLIGDSVRGSLRHLVLDRLGDIDQVLVTDRFFRAELADELAASEQFNEYFSAAVPAILMVGAVEKPDLDAPRRSGGVTIVGCDERFWQLGEGGPARLPGRGEIVLNDRLAGEANLNVQVGDEVLLRVGRASEIPADTALGRKSENIQSRRLEVIEIIPSEGLGRFGLQPSQQLPLNAYVDLATLQDEQLLDQPGRVNSLLAATPEGAPSSVEADTALRASLNPTLEDYGLSLERVTRPETGEPVIDYFNFTSNQMLLPAEVVRAAEQGWSGRRMQPAMTYLANWLTQGDRRTPYSIVTALDPAVGIGPLVDADGQAIDSLADDEIILNSWAADDLQAEIGDEIELTYFEPETTHGEPREATATFRLAAIVPLAAEGEPPTPANDPDLTPELPGVTDQASIDDWNPPFPYDNSRIRPQDETYWDDHRTTPKAFISLASGRKLWSSRFGETTSLRIEPADASLETLQAALLDALEPSESGLAFQPIKRQSLAAAAGTTPFDLLFLGFSMFLIAAALMLVALLFRLGVEQRSSQIGLVLAVGISPRRTTWLLAAEGLLVTALGALLGLLAGTGFAWLMLAGLRTWWLAAVRAPFLELHVTPRSFLIGYSSGLIVCGLTILFSLRRLTRLSVRQLMAGEIESPTAATRRPRWLTATTVVALLLALALAPLGSRLSGEAQAGAFFASGACVLAALLLFVFGRFRGAAAGNRQVSLGLPSLAMRNGGRNPGRSTLTLGLVAAATFLIVAISAFRLEESPAGAGNFDLWATSAAPLYYDLNTSAGRKELGIVAGSDAGKLLADSTITSLRSKAGNDASCLNLYKPRQPRVLGAAAGLIGRGAHFAWADSRDGRDNPWTLLDEPLEPAADGTPRVPAILDMNTALYSLQLWNGVGESFDIEDDQGQPLRLVVVALLKNSIFQGEVLIGEANFLAHFPEVNGYQVFLVDAPEQGRTAVQEALEATLGDYGFDATPTADRLAGFLAVQNTYLATFQSLGGLGLLLGAVGVAVVQLRNAFSRRGELALLRAVGFAKPRLAQLVLLENLALLVGGLAIGVFAALVAVLPHLAAGGASIPWVSLAATLAIVLVVGLAAGLLAVRATLRAPLVAALRGE
ncbi:MAG: FtsX-like permease family protein [Pirellulales bacterium]